MVAGTTENKKELAFFLITRGFWLILVDLVIMSLVFSADIKYGLLILETLWSIGAGMIVLGLVIRLPFAVIFSLGLIIVLGHNLIDIAEANRNGNVPVWWSLLHRVGFIPLTKGHNLLILYPFLPWAGLMLLGYCCGRLFTHTEGLKRRKILLYSGIGLILFFFVLRYANFYGDPAKWTASDSAQQTIFSFMNVQKYPPSLLFLCATIGPGLIFLALIKNTGSRISRIISVYGQVPLFFFVLHFAILHLAQILVYLSSHTVAEGLQGDPRAPFKFAAPGEGFSLEVVYLIWIAVVVVMYPLCRKFGHYKAGNKEKKWLSYL